MNIARLTLSLFLVSCICAGCFAPPQKSVTLEQAQQKFVEICDDIYGFNVTLKEFPDTLWVYLPIEDPLIQVKATKIISPPSQDKSSEGLVMKYADARFKGGEFIVEYDISQERSYLEDKGFDTTLSDEYQEVQTKLFNAIKSAYFDVGINEGDREQPRRFFVVVIADIKRGVKLTGIMYFEDFKRAFATVPSMSQDEFLKRYISELKGDPDLVDDTAGGSIDYDNITMEEFLARQIKNRIKFKYQQSRFPPGDDTPAELMDAVAKTLGAYDFAGYSGVVFKNLADGTSFSASRQEINRVAAKHEDRGRYHVIEFDK